MVTLEVDSDSDATEQLGQGQHGPSVEARTAAGQVALRLLTQQLGQLTSDTRQGRCGRVRKWKIFRQDGKD